MKLSTGKLLLILVVLAVIYGITEFFSSTGKSKSVREELVSINQDEVSGLTISTSESSFNLDKEADGWIVTYEDGLIVKGDESKITNTLNTLQTIKPTRIATRQESKWGEYKVDSTGTRVQVFEDSDSPVLDIVIGRFGVQNQREFYTYVRLWEEKNVYVSDDFMGFSISSDPASFRDQLLSQLPTDSLTSVRFNYPDSGFVMNKSLDGKWLINGTETDSASTAQFFNNVRRVSSSSFFDANPPSMDLSVDFLQDQNELAKYQGTILDDSYFIQSRDNKAVFSDSVTFQKVFKSITFFDE